VSLERKKIAIGDGRGSAPLHRGRHQDSPPTEVPKRAFAEKQVLKGIICHGVWPAVPAPGLVRGRKVVVHNNLIGDARNTGAICADDVVTDGDDLVVSRVGGHQHLFAVRIIDVLSAQ
jgi:protease I